MLFLFINCKCEIIRPNWMYHSSYKAMMREVLSLSTALRVVSDRMHYTPLFLFVVALRRQQSSNLAFGCKV